MANENDGRPLQPLPDQHPGDGGEVLGFSGYGDLPGKRAERINERTPGGAGKTDAGGDRSITRKAEHEAQSRADDARRNASRKRR